MAAPDTTNTGDAAVEVFAVGSARWGAAHAEAVAAAAAAAAAKQVKLAARRIEARAKYDKEVLEGVERKIAEAAGECESFEHVVSTCGSCCDTVDKARVHVLSLVTTLRTAHPELTFELHEDQGRLWSTAVITVHNRLPCARGERGDIAFFDGFSYDVAGCLWGMTAICALFFCSMLLPSFYRAACGGLMPIEYACDHGYAIIDGYTAAQRIHNGTRYNDTRLCTSEANPHRSYSTCFGGPGRCERPWDLDLSSPELHTEASVRIAPRSNTLGALLGGTLLCHSTTVLGLAMWLTMCAGACLGAVFLRLVAWRDAQRAHARAVAAIAGGSKAC